MHESTAESAIRELTEQFTSHFNAGEFESLVQDYYAPDARFMAPGLPILQGYGSILEAFRQLGGAAQSIELHTLSVDSSGDLAVETGLYTLTMKDGSQDMGKAIVVYGRQPDGSWRATADIFNSDIGAAG